MTFKRYQLIIALLWLPIIAFAQTPMVDRLMNDGKQKQDKNDYKAAVEIYEKVLALEPKKDEARYELAYSWYKQGDNNKTLHYCRSLTQQEGEFWIEAIILCGSAYDNLGDSKRAISLYNRGIRKQPNQPLLQYNMALSKFNIGKNEEAEQHVRLSLSLDMGHPSAHLLLANIMLVKEERIKSMLSLYFYLLMEQDADRSIKAWDLLDTIWDFTLRQPNKNKLSEYYQAFETRMVDSAKAESRKAEGVNQFAIRTRNFLQNMPETIENGDFWQKQYIPFFKELHLNGYDTPFAYYISSCKYKSESLTWLSENNKLFEQFLGWMEEK